MQKLILFLFTLLLSLSAQAQILSGVIGGGGGSGTAGTPITFATGKTCSNSLAGGSGGISCSAAMTLAASTLVVVGCDSDNASAGTITATDDASNAYTALGADYQMTTSMHLAMFAYFYASGQTRTPKCNYSVNPGLFRDIVAVGYLNAASSSFVDGSGVSGTGDTSPAITAAKTTTSCGSMIVGYAASTVAGTVSGNGNYTVRIAPSGNGNGLVDHIPTSTLNEAASATVPGAWAMVAGAIKPASACQ